MNPATHLLLSWSLANSCQINRRERAMVTLAGVVPDFDGAGLALDLFTGGPGQASSLWDKYHHVLGHNIGFGLLLCLLSWSLATRRWLTSLLVFISFHLHLLGDLVGSKGPDGFQWPIPYLLPFSDSWQWLWSGQWQLNAWPNLAVTLIAGYLMFYLAWKRGLSPLEMVSARANDVFVDTLRQRFGQPSAYTDSKRPPL
ncbi:MAG: hypothetical protein OET90_00530 [Desulfuromonadales bacterium]|nr:hypothetical protein [Desulfuromonadales bacterium]